MKLVIITRTVELAEIITDVLGEFVDSISEGQLWLSSAVFRSHHGWMAYCKIAPYGDVNADTEELLRREA